MLTRPPCKRERTARVGLLRVNDQNRSGTKDVTPGALCTALHSTISSYSYRGQYSRDTSESNISLLPTLRRNTSSHILSLKLRLAILALAGSTRSMQEVPDVGGSESVWTALGYARILCHIFCESLLSGTSCQLRV